jgi:predicted component of viral defense system (DUF524 family)
MELLNSGDNLPCLEVNDKTEECWVRLEEAYFEEAASYKWRFNSEDLDYFTMQGIPQSMVKNNLGYEGILQTPFNAGNISFELKTLSKTVIINSFIYPDSRKLTIKQYEGMISDILKEANICLKYSGLSLSLEATGVERRCSIAQWNYIERNMGRLKKIFAELEKSPLKVLVRNEHMIEADKVKRVETKTEKWIEKYGPKYGGTEMSWPLNIMVINSVETYDVYENRVLKLHLTELQVLLRKYCMVEYEEIRAKARHYLDLTGYWLTSSFLTKVRIHSGIVNISQVFRKHPFYRMWFNWFSELYNHKDLHVGFKNQLPLKDTFQIYEIWAFMKVIKLCREAELLEDTSGIFLESKDGIFLELSEHNDSKVKLKNGGFIYYQRSFQSNSSPYYTYTQRMIPDIVLEVNDRLIVLDPKYRVDANLTYALAEMHKYRDGILRRADNNKAVEETYILTPRRGEQSDHLYEQEYLEKYKMGAFEFRPEGELDSCEEQFSYFKEYIIDKKLS